MKPSVRVAQSEGVTTVYLDFESAGSGQQVLYLFSDVHFDSIFSARDVYLRHLEMAKNEGALILDGGDLFDAMQGRFDPRRSMDELDPKYRREDYYDFVVRDVASALEPFADNIIAMATGNHELAVRKNAGTDLTERLVWELRRSGSPVVRMGFKGWIRIVPLRPNGRPLAPSVYLRFAHSGGGNSAPVTRGVIDTNRQAVYLPDANIVWNGHNHDGWIVPIARERISSKGVPYRDVAWFVRTPGYKADYIADDMGFAAQKGGGPKPIGCARVTLRFDGHFNSIHAELIVG